MVVTSPRARRVLERLLMVCGGLAMLVAAPAIAQTRESSGASEALVLPGEWMLPVARARALAGVRQTVRALGLELASDDDATRLFRTRRARYRPSWPGVTTLRLSVFHRPSDAEFHIFVPSGLEPARLVVGAILDADVQRVPLKGSNGKGEMTFYSHRPLGEFLATAVAATLGVPLEPLAADPAARADQAQRLLPAGVSDRCGVRAAPFVKLDMDRADRMPHVLHKVRPMYPAPQVERGITGLVTLRGELTEHGTLRGLEQTDGTTNATLIAASLGAAGLWRFAPARVDGCGVRSPISIEMSFSIERRR